MNDITFQQALDLQLKRLDLKYAKLRAFAADPACLNTNSDEMDRAMRGIKIGTANIFALKEAWDISLDCQHANEKQP